MIPKWVYFWFAGYFSIDVYGGTVHILLTTFSKKIVQKVYHGLVVTLQETPIMVAKDDVSTVHVSKKFIFKSFSEDENMDNIWQHASAPSGWQEMDQPDGSPQGRLRSGHADPKATPAAWMPWQGGFLFMIFTRYGYHGHIFGMRIYDDLSILLMVIPNLSHWMIGWSLVLPHVSSWRSIKPKDFDVAQPGRMTDEFHGCFWKLG